MHFFGQNAFISALFGDFGLILGLLLEIFLSLFSLRNVTNSAHFCAFFPRAVQRISPPPDVSRSHRFDEVSDPGAGEPSFFFPARSEEDFGSLFDQVGGLVLTSSLQVQSEPLSCRCLKTTRPTQAPGLVKLGPASSNRGHCWPNGASVSRRHSFSAVFCIFFVTQCRQAGEHHAGLALALQSTFTWCVTINVFIRVVFISGACFPCRVRQTLPTHNAGPKVGHLAPLFRWSG
eukprot:EG_transcript_4708